MAYWQNKRVVIALGGGIAACRALDLIRSLRQQGAEISVAMTPAAERFVTPLTVQALAGGAVYNDLFSMTQEHEMGHIALARWADLVIVAPATANLMARMAHGMADDLVTAMLLARRGPVVVAPAMNSAMWEHPATQRNLATLMADGIHCAPPASGELACGEQGVGRLAPVQSIMETARCALTEHILAGRHLLLTAGPTREPLDPVRYISNRSSGRMGWAVARAARRCGAQVTLVHGPTGMAPPDGVHGVAVTTAREMYQATVALWRGEDELPGGIEAPDDSGLPGGSRQYDIAVMTAAVADYHPLNPASGKITKEKQGDSISVEMALNPDILAEVARLANGTNRAAQEAVGEALNGDKSDDDHPQGKGRRVVVGFAAETGIDRVRLLAKRRRKGCDLLAINDVSEAGSGVDVDTNRIHLLSREDQWESWPLMSKDDVAQRLMETIAHRLSDSRTEAF